MKSITRWMAPVFMGVLFLVSCETDTDETVEDGNWVRQSSYEGVGRSGAISFVVGEVAYVGLGFDGDDYLTDVWSFNPGENYWVKIADFPGVGRTGAVAFSIGDKGYVATGYDGDDELGDVWEYDTTTDTWTQMSDFGGSMRYQAVAFAIDGQGYIGTGYDGNYLKDFWSYDPTTDEWDQIISLKGEKRKGGVAFVVEDYAYVGTGTNNGIYEYDFLEFDSNSIDWNEMTDLDDDDDYDIERGNAVAFQLGGKGYITVGSIGSNTNSTWEYTPGSDTWEEKTAFEGVGRTGAVAFTVGGRSFVGLGSSGSSRFDDLWELLPNDDYDDED